MWSIQRATYTIVFDNDEEISCKCKVIENTKEVFDIEMPYHDNGFDWIDQYITLEDGTVHDVYSWEYCVDYCGDEDTSDWYWFK